MSGFALEVDLDQRGLARFALQYDEHQRSGCVVEIYSLIMLAYVVVLLAGPPMFHAYIQAHLPSPSAPKEQR